MSRGIRAAGPIVTQLNQRLEVAERKAAELEDKLHEIANLTQWVVPEGYAGAYTGASTVRMLRAVEVERIIHRK